MESDAFAAGYLAALDDLEKEHPGWMTLWIADKRAEYEIERRCGQDT